MIQVTETCWCGARFEGSAGDAYSQLAQASQERRLSSELADFRARHAHEPPIAPRGATK